MNRTYEIHNTAAIQLVLLKTQQGLRYGKQAPQSFTTAENPSVMASSVGGT